MGILLGFYHLPGQPTDLDHAGNHQSCLIHMFGRCERGDNNRKPDLSHQIKRVRLKDAQTLEDLLAMSPEKFEALVAVLFKAYGHHVEVVGGNSIMAWMWL